MRASLLLALFGAAASALAATTEPSSIATASPTTSATTSGASPAPTTPAPTTANSCTAPKSHTHFEACRTYSCIMPTASCESAMPSVKTVTTTQTFVEGCNTHVQVGVTPCPSCPKCR